MIEGRGDERDLRPGLAVGHGRWQVGTRFGRVGPRPLAADRPVGGLAVQEFTGRAKERSNGRVQAGAGYFPTRLQVIRQEAFPGLLKSADRKSTRLNSSHLGISYAVFCLK